WKHCKPRMFTFGNIRHRTLMKLLVSQLIYQIVVEKIASLLSCRGAPFAAVGGLLFSLLIFLFLAHRGLTMTPLPVRVRFLFLFRPLALLLVGAGPVRADIIAQYAFGGATGELSMGKDLSGRSGPGWEATQADPNVLAHDAFLSDSIPPSNEDYIEITD